MKTIRHLLLIGFVGMAFIASAQTKDSVMRGKISGITDADGNLFLSASYGGDCMEVKQFSLPLKSDGKTVDINIEAKDIVIWDKYSDGSLNPLYNGKTAVFTYTVVKKGQETFEVLKKIEVNANVKPDPCPTGAGPDQN